MTERAHHRPFIINGTVHDDLYAPVYFVMCGHCVTADHPNALEIAGPLPWADAEDVWQKHSELYR